MPSRCTSLHNIRYGIEEVIEAASLEAARKRADERERELVISDFDTETTTYDIQEANGDNQNN